MDLKRSYLLANWVKYFALSVTLILFNLTASAADSLVPGLPKTKECSSWRKFVLNEAASPSGMKTDQVVVMRGSGETLFSWNDTGYGKSSAHQLWSTSKTISAALIATAIQDKKLTLETPVSKYFPSPLRPKADWSAYEKLTIENLIDMTSGVRWSEHPDDNVREASDLPMMYSEGYRSFTRYILNLDFDANPGAKWNYSSVNADLALAVLKKIYKKSYDEMPWIKLFSPLGLKSAHFEQDGDGVYLGGSYVYLSAEDMAKFGRLYLRDGAFNGTRILPEGWVTRSKTPVQLSSVLVKKKADFKKYGVYSKGGFWLNREVPGVGRAYPRSPESLMTTLGLFGQWIIVLPDQDLVIARTGHDSPQATDGSLDRTASGAIACFGTGEKP
jgi:CubicO group peptidase (beta-lactamase class C family)